MKQKIIATGISGLLGSRVVELLGDKFDFINFSLDTNIDITDFNLLKSKFKETPDAKIVLHLAAFTDVTKAWMQNGDKNGSCYKVNVFGSKNITQLCAQTKKYLIHISTDYIFDGQNPPVGGYTEKNKPCPIEWYGQTKLWAEEEVKKSGADYVILRLAFPFKAKFSPSYLEPNPKLDLVRKIIVKLRKGEKLKMFVNQTITPTFIDDFAKVIDKIINLKPKGIFHCVGSTSLSPYKLALKVARVFNLDRSLIKETSLIDYMRQNPAVRPRQVNMRLCNKKLERELGIKMSTLDEALNKMKAQLLLSS